MLKVLTLILQLDIINCIWIKLWFSISPWEDRGILDKKYICVHRWLFFLWSNGSQSVAPRQSISIACTCYKCRFSGSTSDFLDQKLLGWDPAVCVLWASWCCCCTLRLYLLLPASVGSRKWMTQNTPGLSHLPPHNAHPSSVCPSLGWFFRSLYW